MHIILLLESLKKGDNSEELSIDGRVTFECIVRKLGSSLCSGAIWLGIETSGGLLPTRQ